MQSEVTIREGRPGAWGRLSSPTWGLGVYKSFSGVRARQALRCGAERGPHTCRGALAPLGIRVVVGPGLLSAQNPGTTCSVRRAVRGMGLWVPEFSHHQIEVAFEVFSQKVDMSIDKYAT